MRREGTKGAARLRPYDETTLDKGPSKLGPYGMRCAEHARFFRPLLNPRPFAPMR
jgi:hypothetical protein